jgi:hypothetical protein
VAARRLIAILLVLLFLSSLAAALAPVQEGRKVVSSSTSTTSTTSTTAEAPTSPEAEAAEGPSLISQSVDASGERPALVRAKVGDQLQLRVTSQRSGTVELAGLGPAEDVGSEQPAYFDVLLRDDGSFPVRFLDSDEEIARIEVSPPAVDSTDR